MDRKRIGQPAHLAKIHHDRYSMNRAQLNFAPESTPDGEKEEDAGDKDQGNDEEKKKKKGGETYVW